MSIEERVRKIIAEQLSVSEDKVVPEASFVGDLGAIEYVSSRISSVEASE